MSNVIRFLETMGQDASWRHPSAAELDRMLVAGRVGDAIRTSILHGASLDTLAGAPRIAFCGLLPVREDEDEQDEPSREDDEVRLAVSTTHAA